MFAHLCIPTSLGTTGFCHHYVLGLLTWNERIYFSAWLGREASFFSHCPVFLFFLPPSPSSFLLIRHKSVQRDIKTTRCLIIHLFFQICFYLGQCFPGAGLRCCWDILLGWLSGTKSPMVSLLPKSTHSCLLKSPFKDSHYLLKWTFTPWELLWCRY